MYLIKDQNGNYVSELSFQVDVEKRKEVKYISCGGRCNAMRYYINMTEADIVLKKLQKTNRVLKLDLRFTIVEKDKESVPFGKMETKTFKIIK